MKPNLRREMVFNYLGTAVIALFAPLAVWWQPEDAGTIAWGGVAISAAMLFCAVLGIISYVLEIKLEKLKAEIQHIRNGGA